MRIVYERAHHVFVPDRRRIHRRRTERIIYLFAVAVLVTVFFAGMFFGNVIFSDAAEPDRGVVHKRFHSTQIKYGEQLADAAKDYYDETRYNSFDAYLAEICLINHLMSIEDVAPGEYAILPYYVSSAPEASDSD